MTTIKTKHNWPVFTKTIEIYNLTSIHNLSLDNSRKTYNPHFSLSLQSCILNIRSKIGRDTFLFALLTSSSDLTLKAITQEIISAPCLSETRMDGLLSFMNYANWIIQRQFRGWVTWYLHIEIKTDQLFTHSFSFPTLNS